MRYLYGAILLILFAADASAGGAPVNVLTTDEKAEGWQLLFDGKELAHWKIEGPYEITRDALILGGVQKTVAYLPVKPLRGFTLRLEYMGEGPDTAGFGWDYPGADGKTYRFPPQASFTPKGAWENWFAREYFDVRSFQQRFIEYPEGTSGLMTPMTAVWIEVSAGTKLFLRNIRVRHEASLWPWVTALLLALGALLVLVIWFWRRRRSRPWLPPNTVSPSG